MNGQPWTEDEWIASRMVAQGPQLLRIAQRVLGDRDQAEDVVAETLLKAWSERRRLRAPDKLGPWLARICRNEAISLLRRRRRQAVQSMAPEQLAEIAAGAAKHDSQCPAADILDRLPRELKVCAQMFFFDGHSYAQIAEITGLPLSTVRGRIYLTRKHLQKEIQMTREPTPLDGGDQIEALSPRGSTIR
jgi:RNA polymerase sigma-70 factor (ECF subfamily)